MSKIYKYFATAIIFYLFIGVTTSVFAGLPPPPPGGGGPPCFPPPCMPIDGGISFLLAAGAALGAKKIYDSRKKSSDQ